MAHAPSASQPPMTEEALMAERTSFWNGFCTFTKVSTVAVIVLLVGMAIFLV